MLYFAVLSLCVFSHCIINDGDSSLLWASSRMTIAACRLVTRVDANFSYFSHMLLAVFFSKKSFNGGRMSLYLGSILIERTPAVGRKSDRYRNRIGNVISCSKTVYMVVRQKVSRYRRVRAANIIRRPCSDPSHVTVPYKLPFYCH